jgi:hypothetical protein
MWRKKERTTVEKVEALARRGKDKLKKHFGQQSHDEEEDEVCYVCGKQTGKKKSPHASNMPVLCTINIFESYVNEIRNSIGK